MIGRLPITRWKELIALQRTRFRGITSVFSLLPTLVLSSIIWVLFDEGVVKWQWSELFDVRVWTILGVRSLAYLTLFLLVVTWHGQWTWLRAAAALAPLSLLTAYFAMTLRGPLMVDVLAFAWTRRAALSREHAGLVSMGSLLIIVGVAAQLSRWVPRLKGPRLWTSMLLLVAAMGWLLANALARWEFQWTVLFAFASLPFAFIAGSGGGSWFRSGLKRLSQVTWQPREMWKGIEPILLIGRPLWWGIPIVIIALYVVLPSPGDKPSALSRYLCVERAPSIWPVPLKRLQRCNIRLDVPRYLIASNNRSITPFRGPVEVNLDVPVRLINHSLEPFVIEQIGDVSLGIPAGAGSLRIPHGGNLVKFSDTAVALTIKPKDSQVLNGYVRSLEGTFEQMNESALEALDPRLMEELLKEMRWGRGWWVARPATLSVIVKARPESLELVQQTVVLTPPEGRSYTPWKPKLQGLWGLREGMTKKEVEGIMGPPGGEAIVKKLDKLWSAKGSVVQGALGVPLAVEKRSILDHNHWIVVHRWKYRCSVLDQNIGASCVLYVSLVDDRVRGWRLDPIDERTLEDAKRRFLGKIEERVFFQSDALKYLGVPYWRIRGTWYYPLPEFRDNVLFRLEFLFGAFQHWGWWQVIHVGEGTAQSRGIEVVFDFIRGE